METDVVPSAVFLYIMFDPSPVAYAAIPYINDLFPFAAVSDPSSTVDLVPAVFIFLLASFIIMSPLLVA